MVQVSAVNLLNPPQLIQQGILNGEGLDIDLSSIREHVHFRAATIYVAQSSTGKYGDVAIKSVFAPDVREPHDIRKEIKTLSRLNHASICPLLNAYFIDSHYVLALPFYPHTLLDLLDDPTFIPANNEALFTKVAKCLIKQMCSAVAYLERQQIAHRDIAPSNFLLSKNGQIALTDFGVAYDAAEPGSEGGSSKLQFELGTGPYRAPELLFGSRSYNPFALDRWSLGVTIANFFTEIGPRRPPTPDSDEPRAPFSFMNVAVSTAGPIERSTLFEGGYSDFALIGSIFRTLGTPSLETWPEAKDLPDFGKFQYSSFPAQSLSTILPNFPPQDDGAADLIGSMLRYSYEERLSAAGALQHPWLSDAVDEIDKLDLGDVLWFHQ
ncbi:kinase-like protein [Cystobasidium minutum MCA 4210]|uniref:kinase-like protein n=1 Tax=Cystobasidium minutum MCA 4210 TaxID=1397322 RepID=UPI0034CD2600|eukprot:jgi/Rhomi1/193172/gm1.1386_g